MPLGVPGEWVWERAYAEPDLWWNIGGGTVAAAIFVGFVHLGWTRLAGVLGKKRHGFEIAAWLAGLVVMSFTWLWIVQEIAPVNNRLGKSAFVLYYSSSSGYFTRARYDEPQAATFLAGYEDLMRQGDVLHTGTHPPGLFLVFHGLIAACESSPALSTALDATQPPSFRDACDIIASNNLRRRIPRPLLPLDRRVLWLATLLVMFSASLVVIPLFGLLCRTGSIQSAWIAAAMWPALPAVATFIPKSDAMFPLIGLSLLWLWLTAWENRSLILALSAGVVTWMGLLCSLAFLPVLLAAGLLTIGSAWLFSSMPAEPSTGQTTSFPQPPIGIRRWFCVVAAVLGFLVPTVVLWHLAHVNLLNVWWLNYRNHAGFYQMYPRTYWKWLLVNPLELSFAAGLPVAMLAVVACWSVIRRLRSGGLYERTKAVAAVGSGVIAEDVRKPGLPLRTNIMTVVGAIVFVWGLLWLTGKNSGEAARLWLLFLPWLIWLASIRLDEVAAENPQVNFRERRMLILLAIQFSVCLLTVARVSGFHSEMGNSG